MKLEGPYLVWVDIRKSGLNADELAEKLLRDGKVQVNSGNDVILEKPQAKIYKNKHSLPASHIARRTKSYCKGIDL